MENTKDLIAKLQETTKVDIEAIANGYYDIIPESEKGCMVYGMLPSRFMDMLKQSLKEKFESSVSTIRAFWKDTFYGMDDYLAEAMQECDEYVEYNTNKTFNDVSCRMIRVATERGVCKV